MSQPKTPRAENPQQQFDYREDPKIIANLAQKLVIRAAREGVRIEELPLAVAGANADKVREAAYDYARKIFGVQFLVHDKVESTLR